MRSTKPIARRIGIAAKLSNLFQFWPDSLRLFRSPLSPCVLLIASALLADGQNLSIIQSSIVGGSGTGTNGPYSLSGIIAQPQGGAANGGPYTLKGGVPILPVVVQTLNAPTLHVTNAAPGFATLWWSSGTPGFHLQFSSAVAPAIWKDAPSGATNPVDVSTTIPTTFYRLIKP